MECLVCAGIGLNGWNITFLIADLWGQWQHGCQFTDEKTSVSTTWRPTSDAWAHAPVGVEPGTATAAPTREGLGPGRREGELQCCSWVFHEVRVLTLSGTDVFCDGARTSGRNVVENQGLWVWGSGENFSTGILALVGLIGYVGSKVSPCIFEPFSSAARQLSLPSVPAVLVDWAPKHAVHLPFCFRAAVSFRAGFTVGWNLRPHSMTWESLGQDSGISFLSPLPR